MVTEIPAHAPAFVPHRRRGTALILVASVCWGSSGTLAKPAMLAGLSAEQVAAARIGLAALVLAAGVALVKPSLLRVRRAEWPLLLGYGLLGVAGVQLCYFVAAGRLPVGIAILLEFTSPVLIALWTRFVRGVRLPGRMWAGIALAMAGLAGVAQVWQGLSLDVVGLLAGLGAALCSAAYFLLGEHGVSTRSPIGMVTWGMIIGAVAVCAVAPPWTMPADVLTASAAIGPWHPPVWLLLVAVAVLSTVLAYAIGLTALRHLPAAVASVTGLLEAVVATAAAWALLHETLDWPQLAGAVVLLGGALIVQLTSPRPQIPESP
ncbi:EamA family transporter [Amycolatopsis viridis]|uniref:Drug/metabolite transporter (DMT)-like permease n=1 Tax=Amycolatopsis viridis TaxID=185678 RepID=A0ABX0SXW7_9PSEU|nr:EamA family transporter [Amycolatopsis viridis]NIH81249.1 drug/metabolite transporter (DMT)-like permease [Amycolatopsis viridis]